jgi:hypothetical protein
MSKTRFFCTICGTTLMAEEDSPFPLAKCARCRHASAPVPPAPPAPRALPAPPQTTAVVSEDSLAQQRRIETLEARVAMLEKAVSEAVRAATQAVPASHFKWVADDPPPEFSPERAEVLRHNLRTVPAHRITIQFPSTDVTARRHAEWFKEVFEDARWAIKGPEHAPVIVAAPAISFASCLPVSRDVAATYLALRAAGFPLVSSFDPELRDNEERIVVP